MISKEFQVSATPEVEVHIHTGRVEIRSGEQGTVRVDVETSDPGFVVEQRGDLVYVSSDETTRWLSRGSAFVVVSAPDGADVSVGTAAARVESTANLREIRVKTASGDVDVESAHNLNLKTASGDARIGAISGDLNVSTASGDVEVVRADGKVSFSSASGDMEAGTLTSSLSASTASGDLDINRFEGRQANIKTMSGEASIGIPSGTKLDLDATLLSGRLITPEPSGSKASTERQISLRAKLVSGDLIIKRAED